MNTNSLFISQFANIIQDMLLFRETLGFSKTPYASKLKDFDWFCANYYPLENTLTKSLALEWGEKRANEKINNRRIRLIALRQLGKYINFMGYEAYVIPNEIIGKQEAYEPYLFTDEELLVFFETLDKIPPSSNSSFSQYTLPVFFRIAYGCGLRPNELFDLRRCDVNLRDKNLFVFNSKAKRDRLVAMTTDLNDLCKAYDSIAQRRSPNRHWFFHIEEPIVHRNQWFKYSLTKYWKKAGLDTRLGRCPRVYDFRHNYATRILLRWFDEGKDILTLMPYLSTHMGHVQLHSTLYYIHLMPERLRHNKHFDWDKFEILLPEVTYEE